MNEIINKTDGTIIKWTKTPDNNYFCLLYNDNKNNYSFTPTTNLNCKLFMIGGGGAGGYYFGGGGGAGSAYYNENFLFKQGITYNFNIGIGGKSDITDLKSLFTQGLLLNIYNNVNIDFNKISFTLDDYSSLNINNTGLIQNFIVNDYDTTITINDSIWNNNTFYIWSGYIIPTTNDEYIKISITTHINTAIWIDNYIYTNENALILNTNNNYLNDVKIVKVDPKRYYNIKIIAYCNNNSINNNFNILFSNNCALYNFNKENEQYSYIKSTDTTLNYNDPSLDNPIINLICSGGGNGGCGFANYNNNLDGGCGGGSGINKRNGKSIVDNRIYLGTDGAIGAFCGGGGGISSTGKDNQGGDGLIFDWFDNKLIFGCGGNGGNLKDIRNKGYGCGGNGGDCCYYSKDIINNNGKNGCVIIFINAINNTMSKTIEGFSNNIDDPYDYINGIPVNGKTLKIADIYLASIYNITNVDGNTNIFKTGRDFYDKTTPSGTSITTTTYAGYSDPKTTGPFTPPSFTLGSGNAHNTGTKGTKATGTNNYKDGVDKFFNYFKYNPIYIYDLLCFHKFLIGLYKVLYKQLNEDPYLNIYENLTINFSDATATSITSSNNSYTINLKNIFNIDSGVFGDPTSSDEITKKEYNNKDKNVIFKLKNNENILSKFYKTGSKSLNLSDETIIYNYNDNTDFSSKIPPLPNYYVIDDAVAADNSNVLKSLKYIKSYLENDFTNMSGASTYIRTNDFIMGDFITGISSSSINTKYMDYKRTLDTYTDSTSTKDRHETEIKLLYTSILKKVLNKDNKSTICGELYFYCNLFNLIIINTDLQYGLYRLLFASLRSRPYITNGSTIWYFTSIDGLSITTPSSTTTSTNITTYNSYISQCTNIIKLIYDSFQNFKSTDINDEIINTGEENNKLSKEVIEKQLKLNKIIKNYNDELQLYNTTLSIYKAIIVLAILLLIIIIYIFTYDSNILNNYTKISLFVILALILLTISLYFIFNNNIIYENFSTIANINTSGTLIGTDTIRYSGTEANAISISVTTRTPYTNFYNQANKYDVYDNYQGYITNFVYLANFITEDSGRTAITSEAIGADISFKDYNNKSISLYNYLRYYIAASYNIINNSKKSIDNTTQIMIYKDKRKKFYDNRYEFYYNSIEALKNNKYIYYYLSILYALCVILLLFSLIAILSFGNNTENIILTSIISFLILLVIIYYIYFKLHQRTRLKVNKNYWAYNNPSQKTFDDSQNTNTIINRI